MKMKNRRRIRAGMLSVLLAVAMMAGMLSGCSKKEESSGNTNTGAEATKEADSEEPAKAAEEVAGPAHLTIWSNWDVRDIFGEQGDTPYWQAYQKACNVELEFFDSTGGKDAISVLIASGDLPDIIIDNSTIINPQQALVDESVIALNEAMEAGYMPNFKAYLESDPEANSLSVNDDGLYAWAPMIRGKDSALVFAGNIVRQDWLDELGIEMPNTLQEMEDVLVAFKEKKGADTGYAFAWGSYRRMVNVFGIEEGMYVDADGKVHYGFAEDGYKEFLELFHRWNEMGILDPDAFSQNIDTFYAKVASGRTGLVYGNTGGEFSKFETFKTENPGMDFQPVPNPVINEGDSFPVNISAYRVSDYGAMISSNCKDVEAAARVLDYVYGEEGVLLTNYGIEGNTYEMVDGTPAFTDYVLKNPDGLSLQQALSLYAGNQNKSFIRTVSPYPFEVQQKSLEVWATPEGKVRIMPPVTMTLAETDEYNSIMTTVKTYCDESKLAFIYGTMTLDTWDEFVENLEDMGIGRAIEIQQTAYDRLINR